MAVLRESPWYQEIVQEGFQQGVREGLVEAVLRVLQSRFELSGSTVERLTLQLQKLGEVEVLRQLLVAAVTAEDIEQFQTALEHSNGFTDEGAGL